MKIVSTAEMKQNLILTPHKYPLMIINPSVSNGRVNHLKKYSHIFPVRHENQVYNGLVPNHYKVPINQFIVNRVTPVMKVAKQKAMYPKDSGVFDEVIPDGEGALMLFNMDVSAQACEIHEKLYLLKDTIYEGKERCGVICAYHRRIEEVSLKPAGDGELMIFDITMG